MSNARNLANLLGTSTQIKTAKVADEVFQANQSLIINGDMAVSQRGDVTGVTSGYGGADRYQFSRSGAAAVTLSQDTDVPSNQGFTSSQKVEVTTEDTSLAAGDFAILRQYIEAQNLQHLRYGTSEAKKLTLQFWVKSPKTGTHIAELYHYDATYFTSQSYTIATANTWQKVTMTFDGYQTTAIDNNNEKGLQVTWWLAAGSTYSSGTLSENTWHNTSANRAVGQVNVVDSTSNNFYITGVKLEVGSVATPYRHESYAENLRKCQRYYFKHLSNTAYDTFCGGQFYQNNGFYGDYEFPTTMRAEPTIEVGGSWSVIHNASSDKAVDSLIVNRATPFNVQTYSLMNTNTGTAGHAGTLRSNNDSDAYIAFSAEL